MGDTNYKLEAPRSEDMVTVPLTDAIFGAIIFLGELVAVAEDELATPDVQSCAEGQVSIRVEFWVHCSCLQSS